MWALRRAANPMRTPEYRILITRACCAKADISNSSLKHANRQYDTDRYMTGGFALPNKFIHGPSFFFESFLGSRNLSSHTGKTTSDSEDDDGFSDLEASPESDKICKTVDNENDGELLFQEFIECDSVEDSAETADISLGLLNTGTDSHGEVGLSRNSSTSLFQILMGAPRHSVNSALKKWVEEGNSLERDEISITMLNLRKWKFYGKALQFAEWLEATKRLNFVERDYSSHLDLVAKAHGLQKAEKYMDKIPESFRGEVVYRTLLANCVSALNVKKAEEVFNKIRDLGLPITTFSCNQLLLLYKRVDIKKIPDVLLMMEKENAKPSLFTYQLLIEVKGRSIDIAGMERIVEMMKAEGVEPSIPIQAMVVRHYIFGGLIEKAEAALKEMERDNIKENRDACKALLTLYAALGKADDVERVWKACEANPGVYDCLAAIEAWGKVGRVEKAEEILENMIKSQKKLSTKFYDALLKIYANHKLLSKGKDLVKRMEDNGGRIGPWTLDALVKLYAEGGEVKKADYILQSTAKRNKIRPLYSSYLTVLDEYSKRGDVHNAEKTFNRLRQSEYDGTLRQSGYGGRLKQYQLLLEAYSNAKTPAYGFRERMKADNIFPNRQLALQLEAVDAFRKSEILELID